MIPEKWRFPTVLRDVELEFPTNVHDLMPPMDEIPGEFKRFSSSLKWVRFQSDWFYLGLSNLTTFPREGVDERTALRHLGVIQGSWQPKHEHKLAAVAYLASLWFEDVEWERAK